LIPLFTPSVSSRESIRLLEDEGLHPLQLNEFHKPDDVYIWSSWGISPGLAIIGFHCRCLLSLILEDIKVEESELEQCSVIIAMTQTKI
jgi:hypothetical protein